MAIAIVLAGLVNVLGTVCFEVIDDIGAIMILSGADGFQAGADVPFISTTLNHFLAKLYHWYPNLAWYGWLLLITTVVGASAWIYAVFNSTLTKPTRGVLLLFTIVVLIQCLISPTYTKSALLCLFSAFTLLIQSLSLQTSRLNGKVLIAALYWFSYFWRWKVTLIFSIFAFPVVLTIRHNQLQRLAILIAVIAGPVIVDQLWSSSLETDSSRDFMEFYELRSKFYDRPGGSASESLSIVASKIGWHPDDYAVIRSHFLIHDEKLVSKQTLSRFLEENAKSSSGEVSAAIQRGISAVRENKHVLIIAMVLGLLIAADRLREFVDASSTTKIYFIVVCIGLPGIIGFLFYFRMVPRIAVPIALYAVFVAATFPLAQNSRQRGSALQQILTIVTCLVILVLGFQWVTALHQANSVRHQNSEITSNELSNLGFKPVVVRLTPQSTPGFEGTSPLAVLPPSALKLIPAGWQVRSPRYNAILSQLGFKSGRELLSGWNGKSQLFFVTGPIQHRTSVANQWLSYLKRNELAADEVRISTINKSEKGQGWSLLRFAIIPARPTPP